MTDEFCIFSELKKIPNKAGVYIMYNSNDEIIYVGKAVNLRKRVNQYFNNDKNKSVKVKALVENISRFDYIIVDNEIEALILESNLIKKNKPKYNILLRDDKQYPYIKITEEKFPRLLKVREIKRDGAEYFGPFPNAYAVNDIIRLLQRLFLIRDCFLNFNKPVKLKRPCLNFFIGRCKAPCMNYISEEEYKLNINQVKKFLNGNESLIIEDLNLKMKEASHLQKFELAAKYRDNINSISVIMEKQKISTITSKDLDIIAYYVGEKFFCVQIFFMRNGKIIDGQHFIMEDEFKDNESEFLESFFNQFYLENKNIPKKILTEIFPDNSNLISEYLSQKRGNQVQIIQPKKGTNLSLIQMAKENAYDVLTKYEKSLFEKERKRNEGLETLSKILEIENLKRIEVYDISNISGKQSVGAMVVFENGEKNPKEYRKFKIKTVEGIDDYASHMEVLTRRMKKYIEYKKQYNNKGFGQLPNLIIMDGGKGQVNIAKEVIKSLNLNIAVCGLIKDDKHSTKSLLFNDMEIELNINSSLYKLLYKMQEEVHRFAINYHKTLRSDELKKSILDEIQGVGKIRKKELLKKFKSVENIKKATLEELSDTNSINKATAEKIYDFFNQDKGVE